MEKTPGNLPISGELSPDIEGYARFSNESLSRGNILYFYLANLKMLL